MLPGDGETVVWSVVCSVSALAVLGFQEQSGLLTTDCVERRYVKHVLLILSAVNMTALARAISDYKQQTESPTITSPKMSDNNDNLSLVPRGDLAPRQTG
jgi:hypothetical protein